jgi:hypothetical protein
MPFKRKRPLSILLTPEDLQEFKNRRGALEQVEIMRVMIAESYVVFTRTLKDKYNLPAQYEIDVRTGRATPKDGVAGS